MSHKSLFRGAYLFLTLSWASLFADQSAHLAAQQPVRVQRDWKQHPAIVELDTKEDVFALGDVHGDYDRLISLLTAGNIIVGKPARPEEVQWKAGKAVLVCTGDLIDKGDESLKVIALFQALMPAAAKAGGRFIVTMGNHEAGFLADPTNKKAKEFLKEFAAQKIDPQDVVALRDPQGIGKFLHSLPLAARVNDWFFAHAGHTRGRSIKQLDEELREGIDMRGFDIELVPPLQALIEARLHPTVWWQKGDETPAESRARLESYAKALGVKHLAIGHQPGKLTFPGEVVRRKGEIFQAYDGLIFLIDVGMSRAVDGSEGALLHISAGANPRATAIFPKGPSRQLWPQN
jgi:Calcineurin-like phosphoesterase